MKQINIDLIETADEARSIAIEWQYWISEQDLSYSELIDWKLYFEALDKKFDLLEEFKENGII